MLDEWQPTQKSTRFWLKEFKKNSFWKLKKTNNQQNLQWMCAFCTFTFVKLIFKHFFFGVAHKNWLLFLFFGWKTNRRAHTLINAIQMLTITFVEHNGLWRIVVHGKMLLGREGEREKDTLQKENVKLRAAECSIGRDRGFYSAAKQRTFIFDECFLACLQKGIIICTRA